LSPGVAHPIRFGARSPGPTAGRSPVDPLNIRFFVGDWMAYATEEVIASTQK
jgi:hypothetical protein